MLDLRPLLLALVADYTHCQCAKAKGYTVALERCMVPDAKLMKYRPSLLGAGARAGMIYQRPGG